MTALYPGALIKEKCTWYPLFAHAFKFPPFCGDSDVKLGRLTENSTNRLGTSKFNGKLQCHSSIAIVNIPPGRHCTHPLIVMASLDTRPLKTMWT